MSETRIMTARDGDSCACGCPTARVRVRGNAFAVTCTDCRASAIVPMLAERELREAFGEGEEIAPVVQLRRAITDGERRAWRAELDANARRAFASTSVEFRLPTP